MLEYKLTEADVNNMINALNSVEIKGIEQATIVVALVDKLKSPLNAEDLQKEELAKLKAKFEPEVEKAPAKPKKETK